VTVIQELAHARGYDAEVVEPLWLSLSLEPSLGGHFTLFGASATLVAAGLAQREGMSSFSVWRFLLWAFPLTLVTLVISSFYILVFEIW
jgi:Na+/H+ antiporter NhaD/arsenite permease-like protein